MGKKYPPCSMLQYDGNESLCGLCGTPLPQGRRRWCSKKCSDWFWDNHNWTHAKRRVKRRDKYHCVRAHCPYPQDLEVNHINPINGAGYGVSCKHHQDNLETLCHTHHQIETRRQNAERSLARKAAKEAQA